MLKEGEQQSMPDDEAETYEAYGDDECVEEGDGEGRQVDDDSDGEGVQVD